MWADAPDISVITPTLRQAPFLEQAIDSVADQREVRVEHVVIDGGSDDGTLAILQRRAGPLLRWVSEPDRGQSDAFNKGLSMARAPLIGWLNSDDTYAEGALALVVRRFAKSDADVIYGDTEEIDADGRVRRLVRARGADARALLLQRFMLYHPALFYRRSVFERIGTADPSLHLVMDFDLALRIARHCRMEHLDAVLARHRTHGAAKSARSAAAFAGEYLAVLDRAFADPSLAADLRSLRPAAYQAVHLEGGVRALRAGDRAGAAAHLRAALAARRAIDARTLKAALLLLDANTGTRVGRLAVRALGGQA
jgi:glycosyltransferase involved in cell wall biosynthesis